MRRPRSATAALAPAATPADAAYIDAVYRDLLGRPGDPAGVRFWADRLASHFRTEVVRDIVCAGLEYSDRVAKLNIVRYLHHEPANVGGGTNICSSVSAFDTAELGIAFTVGYGEYYGRAGGTVDAWLTALYADILGRAPDAGGLAFFRHHLRVELGLFPNVPDLAYLSTALRMVRSDEAHRRFVTEEYGNPAASQPCTIGSRLLDRSPQPRPPPYPARHRARRLEGVRRRAQLNARFVNHLPDNVTVP